MKYKYSVDYNWKKIGERIQKERQALRLSQTNLCIKLNLGRNSLVDFEKGRKLPQLDTLTNMCKLFDCDMGYLLCEYDCKYHNAADIKAETGLSEKAINSIMQQKISANLFGTKGNNLNLILEDEYISVLMEKAARYRRMKYAKNVNENELEALAYSLYKDFITILEK
jgi:transcriptional regulator with XRE-family HTH domain